MEILLESLKLGIGPSIVVAIYLSISKFIDHRIKSKQVVISDNITESFIKLNNFRSDTADFVF